MSRLLPELYDARFDEREVSAKDAVWREIVAFLQRFVDPEAPILDLACDRGHFIRWVRGTERWATDIRDMRAALPDDIRFVQASGLDLTTVIPNGYFGTVFMSNYLEHLETSDAVVDQLRVVRQLLRPGGRGDRPAAEHPPGRAALLGLHRPQGRPHRAQPPRGGRAGPAPHGRAGHPVPAVLDQGPAADRRTAGPRISALPTGLVAPRTTDPARRGGARVTAPELSIVMPVFKEGEAVEPALRALARDVHTSHEILVVYDFDEDPTVPVIERLAAELPAVRGYRNDLGRGVLNAMKAGIAGSTGPYVLITMADGSDEPHIVDSMVALARDGADVVAASRYMSGGQQIGGPPLKRLMSRTAGLTLHWFAGVRTHDPTNNFKLYARRFLDAVTIESSAGFELALELTVKATLDGRTVAEVPTTWRDRTAGQSNFKLRKWLPQYLRWYRQAFVGRWFGGVRRAAP